MKYKELFTDIEIILLQRIWKGFIIKHEFSFYSIHLEYNDMLDKVLFVNFIWELVNKFGLDFNNKGLITEYDISLLNNNCRWERCWYNINIEDYHIASLRISFDFTYKWNIYLKISKRHADNHKKSSHLYTE